jgi:hypothetical protein
LTLTVAGSPEALANIHPKARGLVEVYRELAPETLTKIESDSEAQRAFTRELERRVVSVPSASEEFFLFIMSFREKGFCPDQRTAEYLADLSAAPFVDAVAVPGVLPTDVDSYFSYVDSFLHAFASIDHIPILGYIPNFAHRDILKTVNFYLKKGIKDFVFEFNGHHAEVLYPNVQAVNRLLRREVGEDFFIHGLNVGPGAFRRSQEITASKDFLALLSGVDSIGAKHVRKKMPVRVWNRLSPEREKGRRLFARYDYGYYEPKVYAKEFGHRNEEGVISANAVCRNPLASTVKLFNAERQALETSVVRKHLSEGNLLEHARSKSHLRHEVERVAAEWKQQTL